MQIPSNIQYTSFVFKLGQYQEFGYRNGEEGWTSETLENETENYGYNNTDSCQ